jgi:hypothetical protein
MYTIIKADRRQFTLKRPIDYPCIVLMRLMLAAVPVSLIYYIIDCLVRGGR